MTNAERLASWRKKKGWSQDKVAKEIGAKQGTWAPWESGAKMPGLANALAIEKLTRGAVKAKDWGRKHEPAAASGTDVTASATARSA